MPGAARRPPGPHRWASPGDHDWLGIAVYSPPSDNNLRLVRGVFFLQTLSSRSKNLYNMVAVRWNTTGTPGRLEREERGDVRTEETSHCSAALTPPPGAERPMLSTRPRRSGIFGQVRKPLFVDMEFAQGGSGLMRTRCGIVPCTLVLLATVCPRGTHGLAASVPGRAAPPGLRLRGGFMRASRRGVYEFTAEDEVLFNSTSAAMKTGAVGV